MTNERNYGPNYEPEVVPELRSALVWLTWLHCHLFNALLLLVSQCAHGGQTHACDSTRTAEHASEAQLP